MLLEFIAEAFNFMVLRFKGIAKSVRFGEGGDDASKMSRMWARDVKRGEIVSEVWMVKCSTSSEKKADEVDDRCDCALRIWYRLGVQPRPGTIVQSRGRI